MRAVVVQAPQLVGDAAVVAVTQQDDAVRAVADLVLVQPVVVELLERHQHVVFFGGGAARDVAQHGEEKRVDLGVVGGGIRE
jgi:DNA-binding MurR/RpiR family transcriptional regulator